MRRIFMTAAALTMLSTPVLALAENAESKTDKSKAEFSLPTKAEMQNVLDQMPDFNGILGDFKEMAEDEKLQKRLENVGESFVKKLEKSGALEKDKNGLPDINKAIEVMLFAFTEDDVAGELLDTMSEFQDIVEKNMPEKNIKKID